MTFDNEKNRQESSQLRFGHPDATWEEIDDFDKERNRQYSSQLRFGHPRDLGGIDALGKEKS